MMVKSHLNKHFDSFIEIRCNDPNSSLYEERIVLKKINNAVGTTRQGHIFSIPDGMLLVQALFETQELAEEFANQLIRHFGEILKVPYQKTKKLPEPPPKLEWAKWENNTSLILFETVKILESLQRVITEKELAWAVGKAKETYRRTWGLD